MGILIIFVGLIAQVNQPWSFDNTAVIPVAEGHIPTMSIPLHSVIGPDKWVTDHAADGSTVVINLMHVKVRVTGTRGIFSDLMYDYVYGSVPVGTIAPTCKLRKEVRNREYAEDIAAYIDYRGGHMMPESYLRYQLSFENTAWSIPRCAVCTAAYKAELRGDSATLLITELEEPRPSNHEPRTPSASAIHTIKIAPGTEVIVRNLPERTVKGGHFHALLNIYEGHCSESPEPTVHLALPCQNTNVCTSQTFHHGLPDPGDDCTIIRHP